MDEYLGSVVASDGSTVYSHRSSDGSVTRTDGQARPHNPDGPAKTCPDGYIEYLVEGEYHRLDGPAVSFPDGYQVWMISGVRSRLDGPAVTLPDGRVQFWVAGHRFNTEAEYWNYVTGVLGDRLAS